ncbi:hypothetical protein [Aeromicrobium phragmitis]|nr:hypothetical protein [Aeromicrobium phragmitis]
MSPPDWRRAARLALPADAQLTGFSRLQELGLDEGPVFPLHFVVARDHHVRIDGITLHRTDRMPPLDDVGVTPAAAFIAVCAESTVMTAACIGDWLLHRRHMGLAEVRELAQHERWRAGAVEALWIGRYLDAAARSIAESRWRMRLAFAGLPAPAVNAPILDRSGAQVAIGDLAYLRWRTVAEYEGEQHQRDRAQYLTDITRYGDFRDLGLDYVQLTRETPAVNGVLAVYRALRANGYAGPPPAFGARWRSLGAPLSRVARSGAWSTHQAADHVDGAPQDRAIG